jgi:3-hydroxyisobutyrate dehydrogenase-like beta-hydroxyacid dehydrogenase
MVEKGAHAAASAADVAGASNMVITCVTTPEAVESCVLGPAGLIEGLRPDATVIEMTTSMPSTTRNIAAAIRAAGADIIDAPVSRGIPAAQSGTLSIMVGGNRPSFERARRLLETLGTDIVHVGDLGAGHAVKLINMLLMAVHLLALTEALAVAASAGVRVRDALAVFQSGKARTFMSDHHFPKYVVTGRYTSNFALHLMHKDVLLGVALAQDAGVPAPFGNAAGFVYGVAKARGLGQLDNMYSVPFWWQVMAGDAPEDAARSVCDNRSESPMFDVVSNPAVDTSTVLAELEGHLALTSALAAAEAAAIAVRSGVDVRDAFGVIDVSSGSSAATERLATDGRVRNLDQGLAVPGYLSGASDGTALFLGGVTEQCRRLAAARRGSPAVVNAFCDVIGLPE